ncbi:hypothetical protein AN618_15310 [Fervidicola ferrireducens]|uniref:Protein-glutamine gamma-glutamyltransferase-like C-terminal domain-containing protein n=1 Tax=Fervidicola ferrireducens TaxID=520764 RepID=A0A140L7W3_9FIRM|nr:DUF4129 domain-containing protein [Fervidicola ferrireducens]KXG76638.1 hypothetical protein AN618_15310 [Fervidicola ferrireducens]
MRFPSFDWYRLLKIILFYIINSIFALIILSVFERYAPGMIFPVFEVLSWLFAGIIFNAAYNRFERFRKPLFIAVLVLITVLKIGSGYYGLVAAFFCFILGAGQGLWVMRHYELMSRLKQYSLLILFSLLFYKGKAGELLLLLTGYISISLVVLSVYYMETVSPGISRERWLLTALIVSITTFFFTLLFAEFVSPEYVSALLGFLTETYFALIEIVMKILTPVLLPVVYALDFIISALSKRTKTQYFPAGTGEPGGSISNYEYQEYITPEGMEIFLKITGLILIILAFAVLILIVLKKYTSWDKKDFEGDEKEPVLKPGAIKKSLFHLMSKAGTVLNSFAKITYGDSPSGKIRRIYAKILKEAAKRGYYRNSSETPMEFMPQLKKAFEDAGELVEKITYIYQKARYFPGSVSIHDVEEMKKSVKLLLSK